MKQISDISSLDFFWYSETLEKRIFEVHGHVKFASYKIAYM